MRRIFGIKHVGIFFPIIELGDNCFYYKNKRYTWDNILAMKRQDDLLSRFIRYPSTIILLNDGAIVKIPAILHEKNTKQKFRLTPTGYNNSPYEQVIGILENKAVSLNNNMCNYLFSYNYIMIYRLLFIISILFLLFILIATFALRVKYDFPLISVTILTSACMAISITMMIRRHLKESIIRKKLKELKGDS